MSDAPQRFVVRFANVDKSVLVPENANLREVCLRENIPLYFGLGRLFNCEGRARCGTCLVRILEGSEGLTPETPFELKRGSGGDASLRLACQVHIRGPVTIDTRA